MKICLTFYILKRLKCILLAICFLDRVKNKHLVMLGVLLYKMLLAMKKITINILLIQNFLIIKVKELPLKQLFYFGQYVDNLLAYPASITLNLIPLNIITFPEFVGHKLNLLLFRYLHIFTKLFHNSNLIEEIFKMHIHQKKEDLFLA